MAVDVSPPVIPDHELLRVIGRGAYGEIWLARSLIGALRAVKVVWRSTFENERAFHREFEGMSRFEPFSRAHPGFVDILHVGRRADFFYYIMELADDSVSGRQIDPIKYLPHTLKADLQEGRQRPLADCLKIGLQLTEALGALHQQQLTHRDIKPANIIFVEGAPKLADIGLVAVTGQRSFVGTEGYVPPEGPGTAQGDLYSLGKVLYEISTGKDRLDFPAVNTDLTRRPDKELLLRLNDVFLRACANDPGTRYDSAEQMHADLTRVEQGERIRRPRLLPKLVAAAAIGMLTLTVVGLGRQMWKKTDAAPSLVPAMRGEAIFATEPPGAMVLLGDRMARSPAVFMGIEPGKYPVRIMRPGYDPVETNVEIKSGAHYDSGTIALTRSKGALQLLSNPPGALFELLDVDKRAIRTGETPADIRDLPTGEYEATVRLAERKLVDRVEIQRSETARKMFDFADGMLVVTSDPPGVNIAVDGTPRGQTPLRLELSSGPHEITATCNDWPPQQQTVQVENRRESVATFEFGYGSVKITSAPAGAMVISGGAELGQTPLWVEEIAPGDVEFQLHLAGYEPAVIRGAVRARQQSFLAARLDRNLRPEPGKPWENSLGMRFLPVGNIRVCAWETRVQDYAAFCDATGAKFEPPDFPQTDLHPIVKVNWYEAQAFCKWLTEKERADNLLTDVQSYRLPTDLEWSLVVGLTNESGRTPEERDGKVKDHYPWGRQWPPDAGAGNYSDQTAKSGRRRSIDNYQDGFAQTAPAGSYAANQLGFHDLGGNAWEWCEEGYKGVSSKDWGVLRGGSWANSSRGELQSSYRNVVDRNERDVIYGFRCALVGEEPR